MSDPLDDQEEDLPALDGSLDAWLQSPITAKMFRAAKVDLDKYQSDLIATCSNSTDPRVAMAYGKYAVAKQTVAFYKDKAKKA